MEKRSSAVARLVAAIALLGAALVVIVVIAAAMSSDDSSPRHKNGGQPHAQKEKKQRTKAKTYTVESGDTLTTIAHKTGIPIAELQALNPEVDPQILTVGETLQLR